MNSERNAITEVFDTYKGLSMMLGVEAAEQAKRTLLDRVKLDKDRDAPIPQWLIRLLSCGAVGYRSRIRIAFLHHRDITGEVIDKNFMKKRGKYNKSDIKITL